MWKSGKHVENYVKEKCTKKLCFFVQKVEQNFFEKKPKKKKENRNRPPNYYNVTFVTR